MIKFRQKDFAFPLALLANSAMVGMTGLQMKQGADQAKEAEAQAERQAELIQEQNRKLDKLAKAAKNNPQVVSSVPDVLQQKQYAAPVPPPKYIKAVGDFASKYMGKAKNAVLNTGASQKSMDLVNKARQTGAGKVIEGVGKSANEAFGKPVKNNLKLGIAVGATTYGAGKYIQHDMKKNGMQVGQDGNIEFKQASYGIVSNVAGMVKNSAAGKWTNQQATKALNTKGGQVAKNSFDAVKYVGKKHGGTVLSGVAFGGGMPLVGYMADKKQAKDQVEATRPPLKLQQKDYAIPGVGMIKGLGSSAVKAVKGFNKDKIGKTTGFLSMGVGGTKNVQKFGQALVKNGEKSGSNAMVGVGKWIGNHKTAANAIAAVPAIGVGAAAWDKSAEVVKGATKKIDPHAYDYINAKEKQNGN